MRTRQITTAIALAMLFASCAKKSTPLPNTLQFVTNGEGHTDNSGLIASMTIVNQNGVTVFHTDTINFEDYIVTYNITINPGDVLKATWNSNEINLGISPTVVDMQFIYGGKVLDDIQGGIYNTTAFYNNNPTVNNTILTIPK